MPIGRKLIELGYEVHLISAMNSIEASEIVASSGIKFHSIRLSRSGLNIFSEAISFFEIFKLMNNIQPSLVHLVTIKPIIYGGVAARILRIDSLVVAVAGLGYLFMTTSKFFILLRLLVVLIFKNIFSKKKLKIIFQNSDDQLHLLKLTNLNPEKTTLIKGSGVNLDEFISNIKPSKLPYIVTMASRLLRDKGVTEYVEAAKILSERGVSVEFRLVGDIDIGNPSSLSVHDLSVLKKLGIVKLYGHRNDISALYNESRIIVLPSYREGLPKALIEAASCGRPVITTDVPGCRDAIVPGHTGLLVPPYDSMTLANAIENLIFDDELCDNMGEFARLFAEMEFSIKEVVNRHLSIYKSLLGESS